MSRRAARYLFPLKCCYECNFPTLSLLPFLYQTPTIQRRQLHTTLRRQQTKRAPQDSGARGHNAAHDYTGWAPAKIDHERHYEAANPRRQDLPMSSREQPFPSNPDDATSNDHPAGLGRSQWTPHDLPRQPRRDSQHPRPHARPSRRAEPSSDRRLPFERLTTGPDPIVSNDTSNREDTMTDNERKAFARLFGTLLDKSGSSGRRQDAQNQGKDRAHTGDADSRIQRFEDEHEEDEEDEEDQYVTDLQRWLPPIKVDQYPRELQGMAATTGVEVLRQQQRRATEQRLKAQGKEYNATEAAQRKELRRIENALYKASTDVDIWRILENDVFAKLSDLDVLHRQQARDIEATEPVARARRNDGSENKSRAKKKTTKRSGEKKGPEPTDTKALDTLAVNDYAKLFLLSARLLCRRTTHSPLTLTLLSQIRSHSLTSSILGTSAPLYNEIMSYHWRHYADLGAVLSLLQDMNSCGVTMNSKTLNFLETITLYRFRAQRGDFGAAVQAVENMRGRQREALDLKAWKRRIRVGVESRAIEKAKRTEAERRMRAEGAFDDVDTATSQSEGATGPIAATG